MRALLEPAATSLREEAKCHTHSRTEVTLRVPFVQLPPIAIAVALLTLNLGTGCCSPCHLAGRTLIGEPSRYSIRVDRKRSLALYRTWAEREWQQVAGSCTVDCPLTTDYRTGFVEGFVDFAYSGGTGEPSPVPPREYWNISQRSPNGKECVNQWFAGFRHGARVAHDGGYREAGTVQISLAESPVTHPLDGAFDGSEQISGPVPHEETLPPPQSGNPQPEQPLPAAKPHAPVTPPNTAPDNPFREDETTGSTTDVPTTSGVSAQPPQNETQQEQADNAPAELKLPTEPIELPADRTETASPLPPGEAAPHYKSAAQAFALRDAPKNEVVASSAKSSSGDETTPAYRAGGMSRRNTPDPPKRENEITSGPATAPSASGQWRSHHVTGGIRQPDDTGVNIEAPCDNANETCGAE